jgi:hypothetical protein
VFSFISEDPIKTYDYVSRNACPTNSGGSSPTPTPSSGNLGCHYLYNSDPSATNTLCALQCPTALGGYSLESNWPVARAAAPPAFFTAHISQFELLVHSTRRSE